MNNQWFSKIAVWLVIAMVLFTVFKQFDTRAGSGANYVGYSDFLEEVRNNRIKSATARAYNEQRKRTGALWARAYHEHLLRGDDDVKGAARYLVANPVRAGLVKRVGDYPFWDAVWIGDRSEGAVGAP